MSVFTNRSGGYKGGVFLLFFSTLVFLVGFFSPFWMEVKVNVMLKRYDGLWMYCLDWDGILSCSVVDISAALLPWFRACQALEAVSALVLFVGNIYCLVVNCCKDHNSRILEALTGFGGVTGFTGAMVCLGMTYESFTSESDPLPYSWAFYLASIGSGLAFVSAIIIAINNKPLQQRGATTVAMPAAYIVQDRNSTLPFNVQNYPFNANNYSNVNNKFKPQPGNDLVRTGYQRPRGTPEEYSKIANGGQLGYTQSAKSQPGYAPPEYDQIRYSQTGYDRPGYSNDQAGYNLTSVHSGPYMNQGESNQLGYGQADYNNQARYTQTPVHPGYSRNIDKSQTGYNLPRYGKSEHAYTRMGDNSPAFGQFEYNARY